MLVAIKHQKKPLRSTKKSTKKSLRKIHEKILKTRRHVAVKLRHQPKPGRNLAGDVTSSESKAWRFAGEPRNTQNPEATPSIRNSNRFEHSHLGHENPLGTPAVPAVSWTKATELFVPCHKPADGPMGQWAHDLSQQECYNIVWVMFAVFAMFVHSTYVFKSPWVASWHQQFNMSHSSTPGSNSICGIVSVQVYLFKPGLLRKT